MEMAREDAEVGIWAVSGLQEDTFNPQIACHDINIFLCLDIHVNQINVPMKWEKIWQLYLALAHRLPPQDVSWGKGTMV